MWNMCTVRVFACCRIFLWLFIPPPTISQPVYLFFQAWSGWHFPRGTFACLSRAPEEKLLEKEGKGGSNQPCWELFLNKSWVMPESGPWGWMFHTRAEYQRCPCSPDPKPWVGLLPTPATYPGSSHISCKHILLPACPTHGKNSSVDRNLSTRGDKEPSHTWRCVCKPSGPGSRHSLLVPAWNTTHWLSP